MCHWIIFDSKVFRKQYMVSKWIGYPSYALLCNISHPWWLISPMVSLEGPDLLMLKVVRYLTGQESVVFQGPADRWWWVEWSRRNWRSSLSAMWWQGSLDLVSAQTRDGKDLEFPRSSQQREQFRLVSVPCSSSPRMFGRRGGLLA